MQSTRSSKADQKVQTYLSQIKWLAVAWVAASSMLGAAVQAEEIGSVNTKFKVFGSDKVVIDAFDDPKVDGVTCYVSRAKTGGISGTLGLAEDTADASIACRQVGPIKIKEPLLPSDEVFNERRSLIFKSLQVVRFVDQRRNALVYLTYSDRVLEGSPKNSITAVPVLEGQKIPMKK
jgi:CreA protein